MTETSNEVCFVKMCGNPGIKIPIFTSSSRNNTLCVRLPQFIPALLFLLVVFPQDLLEKGLDASNFAMLGLGDIVIPGKYTKRISETFDLFVLDSSMFMI